MKTITRSNIKFIVLSLCILCVVDFGEIIAQPNSIVKVTDARYALENLLDGIKSTNNGVRRSSIYFAGKYKISETEEILIEQLREETKPDNRILIALVLYNLQSEEGMIAVKKIMATDNNSKVRTMYHHIYKEYMSGKNKNEKLAFN